MGGILIKYIAVTATRNEDELDAHIQTILDQSVRPLVYVVVDDMSDPPVIRSDCIVIRSNQKRSNVRGVNQSHALNRGVEYATQLQPGWAYLLKTDVDTRLPVDYAYKNMRFLAANPYIGITSGISNQMGITQQPHRPNDAAKMFDRQCWHDIGGYTETNAFDTHATLKAIRRGYRPEINKQAIFTETRPSRKTSLKRWIESGKTRKTWGFPLWHTCLAAGKNLFNGKPIILGPLSMIYSHATYDPPETMFPEDWINEYAKWELENIVRRKKF